MRKSTPVDEFQFSTQCHAMGEATDTNTGSARELRKHMRRCLTFDSRVGGHDQFFDFALSQPGREQVQPKFFRPQSIQR